MPNGESGPQKVHAPMVTEGGFHEKASLEEKEARYQELLFDTLIRAGLATNAAEAKRRVSGDVLLTELSANSGLMKQVELAYKRAAMKSRLNMNASEFVDLMMREAGEKLESVTLLQKIGSIPDRATALIVAHEHGWALPFFPEEFLADKEVAIAAVRNLGAAYAVLPNALKLDRDVALASASYVFLTNGSNWNENLPFLPDIFKNDRNFVIEFVTRNPDSLAGLMLGQSGDPILQEFYNDKEIILAAVRTYAWAIRYVPVALRNDRDVVLAAVKNDGSVLRMWGAKSNYSNSDYNKRLSDDKDVALAAIRTYPQALQWASNRLCADIDVVREAVERDPNCIEYADPKIQEQLRSEEA